MISQQFIDYIKHQLAAGISREDIKKALKINGLSEQDIAEGFAMVEGTQPPITAPQAAVVLPASLTPSVAPNTGSQPATVTVPEGRPQSVRYFELLMYASIAVSAFATVYQYGNQFSQLMSSAVLLVLAVPALIVIVKFFLVWLAAHQRKNWARIILLVPFLVNVLSVVGIILVITREPILGILTLASIALQIGAFCFAFTSASNKWFTPQDSIPTTPGQVVDNTIWRKGIPGTNIGFMIASLLLVFGLDLFILYQSQWSLLPFWIEMLVVLGIFGIFFFVENYSFKKRFVNSHSTLDTWISAVIVIRNIVFVLNFIPVIQIAGAAGVILGGIPFLILYTVLLSKRSKVA